MSACAPAINTFSVGTTTVSAESDIVLNLLNKTLHELVDYRAVDPLASALHQLATVFVEASKPNWDGYGAVPVTLSAMRNAERFLQSLPSDFLDVEISAEPDGEIAIEWFRNSRVLSVSIGADQRIAYAGRDGSDRWRGTSTFIDSIPYRLFEDIRRLLSF